MASPHASIRHQLGRAVWNEVDRVGLSAFRPSVVVADFMDCGAGRSTLFGWISKELQAGAPERVLGRQLAELGLQPIVEQDIGDCLGRLRQCVEVAAAVLDGALAGDGAARRPRIALAAVEQLRLAVEAAFKVSTEGAQATAVTAFMAAVAEQVRLAPPAIGRQITDRLRAMTAEGGRPA